MCTLLASCLGSQVVADYYVNNTHWTWAGKCVQVLCILKKYYTLKLFFPLLWLKNPKIGHLIVLNNFSEGQAFWINWRKTNCDFVIFCFFESKPSVWATELTWILLISHILHTVLSHENWILCCIHFPSDLANV